MFDTLETAVTDDQLLADLERLSHTVAVSATLTRGGISDSLATLLKQMRANPVNSGLAILDIVEGDLKHHIEGLLMQYLNAFSSSIEAVYKTQRKGRILEYVLAMRSLDLDVKFDINEFALAYMRTSFQGRWPLVIHYITPDKATALMGVDKLELAA